MGEKSTAETEEEILAWARKYAEEQGWELNPDEKQLRIVIKGLARNRKKYGERHCNLFFKKKGSDNFHD